MAYSKKVIEAVRRDYVKKGYPLTQAASVHKVPYDTARNWKRKALEAGDDWDNQRRAQLVSKAGVEAFTGDVLEEFVQLFKETIKEVYAAENMASREKADIIARLSDAYIKTLAAAAKGNPKLNTQAIAMDVLKRLADFIRQHHAELLPPFIDMLEAFGKEINRVYS